MSLPNPPLLTGDDHVDLLALYSYMYDLIRSFPNAVGQAIDPTSQGQGGAGSLTVDQAPTNVVYSAESSMSRDGVLFGSITVSFDLPDRAVAALVYYKEHGTNNWHVSLARTSPFALQSLKVGTLYDVKLTGQAANGNIGPFSPETIVAIPVGSLLVNHGWVSFPDYDDSFEPPMFVPGPPGRIGPQGPQGPQGLDAEEPEVPYSLPGAQGFQGIQGPQGVPGLDGIDAEEMWIVIDSTISVIP